MPEKRTTKEKLLAIILVFVLFLSVAILFGYIGLYNRQVTAELVAKVRAERIERETKNEVSNMGMFDFNPANVSAKSFLVFAITDSGFKNILKERNSSSTLPIASVTKLMTAIVTLENIDLKSEVIATPDYVGGDGTAHILEIGRTYKAGELIKNMLISSDNDSAQLISSILGAKNFIDLMNKKAEELNLTHTHFVNATGLDPLLAGKPFNISSAEDLAEIILYVNKNHPEIFQITRLPKYDFCDTTNVCKIVMSTDHFLTDSDFKFKIIGAKTGQTVLADKNLALITEPLPNISLISIVLGTKDNFLDTQYLINHVKIGK